MFGYFVWPKNEPNDNEVATCHGCLTKLEIVTNGSENGWETKDFDCPTCHGDNALLAEFKNRVKKYEKQGLHPAHAVNKVRKEIRENG